MEQRSVLLKGIARVLNAGGSALLDIYDAATSIKISALPGEKGKLKGNIRAYEKKIERLYYEIGKEVSRQDDTTRVSAAGEAGVKLVAEYRAEIEVMKQRIEEIEAAEKIERQRLLEEREAARTMKRQAAEKQVKMASEKAGPRREAEREVKEESYAAEIEPVIIAEPSLPEAPVASEILTGAETEEEKEVVTEAAETEAQEIGAEAVASAEPEAGEVLTAAEAEQEKEVVTEAAETPEHELQKESAESEAPVSREVLAGAETEEEKGAVAEVSETEKEGLDKYTTEELENMLKADLLALCAEKGIEADRRMTKAQIIELILTQL